ncbi:MAG: cytochrome b/b6 domain-containing protein [Cypionkella sp.]
MRADLHSPAAPDARSPKLARVWDPLVRLFHWSLVAGFTLAWFSANRAEGLHIWAGYAASSLILLRLIWGFVGTGYARFTSFVRGPRAVTGYVLAILHGHEARYIGHNPAGGAMVLALMAGVLGLGVTGWMQYTDAYYGVDWVSSLHGLIADGMVALILIHLGGVALASIRHRENLVRAMITGRKRAPQDHDIA